MSALSLSMASMSAHADEAPGAKPDYTGQALHAYRAKDYNRAYKLLEASEHTKTPIVYFQLGMMDLTGEGTVRDWNKAKRRFNKACELDFEIACTAVENIEKNQHR